jgi:hypothetical protein
MGINRMVMAPNINTTCMCVTGRYTARQADSGLYTHPDWLQDRPQGWKLLLGQFGIYLALQWSVQG